ncbi:GD20254 [Drosophila simulans]|uniref:Guanine nucleotide-binding protein-like 3 homolog n=2 Tax=Drosophila simulans TaxID=7240 RepID=B4QWC2_DROSI|nr:GD20254 [Drosophila simulans]
MLGNYCRNKGIKTSIRVGVVGIPNVGKSSIINSLTRGRSCMVGSTPGVTKSMQEVELDSKIKLIDCPGIVFTSGGENSHAVLKNAQRVGDVKDPFTIAESVLKRASKEYFCTMYDITNYDTFEEFFAKKAARMGKFLKKGVPDVVAAARSVLNDWNTGKIKYCTQPPEVQEGQSVHISASIVHSDAREFDVENFESMETEILEHCAVKTDDIMEITSSGPLEIRQPREEAEPADKITASLVIDEKEKPAKGRKRKLDEEKEKVDPSLLLEENQSLNKGIKQLQKLKKKQNVRNEKKISKITDVLDSFSLGSSSSKAEKYDFDEDYVIE